MGAVVLAILNWQWLVVGAVLYVIWDIFGKWKEARSEREMDDIFKH